MNTIDFCYWLQGFFELSECDHLSEKQTTAIKNHLNLVFKHEIDPLRDSQTTTPIQVLNETHSPSKFNDYFPLNDERVRC